MTRAGEAGADGAAPTTAADAGLEGWTLHAQYACRHDESEVIEERGDGKGCACLIRSERIGVLRRRPKAAMWVAEMFLVSGCCKNPCVCVFFPFFPPKYR